MQLVRTTLSAGAELVLARAGEEHGWAGRVLRIERGYVLLERAGDGRRVVFFAPADVRAFAFRSCTPGEAATIGVWQRRGLPGCSVLNGGGVRVGNPENFVTHRLYGPPERKPRRAS